MVNVCGFPVQPLATGIALMVAVTGWLVLLIAVKDEMFPEPVAASPMVVLLFVQLNIVPFTEPEYITGSVRALLQRL